jgi:hypothetical protein
VGRPLGVRSDYDRLQPGDTIRITDVAAALKAGREIAAAVDGSDEPIMLWHHLSERQIDILLAGGAINWRGNAQSEWGQTSLHNQYGVSHEICRSAVRLQSAVRI